MKKLVFLKDKSLVLISTFFIILPLVAEAQTVKGIIFTFSEIVADIIRLLWVVAVAAFLWGIIRFILAAGNPEELKKAKSLIIYGLIGLFVMFSFLGIIKILQNTFFLNSSGSSYQQFPLNSNFQWNREEHWHGFRF